MMISWYSFARLFVARAFLLVSELGIEPRKRLPDPSRVNQRSPRKGGAVRRSPTKGINVEASTRVKSTLRLPYLRTPARVQSCLRRPWRGWARVRQLRCPRCSYGGMRYRGRP